MPLLPVPVAGAKAPAYDVSHDDEIRLREPEESPLGEPGGSALSLFDSVGEEPLAEPSPMRHGAVAPCRAGRAGAAARRDAADGAHRDRVPADRVCRRLRAGGRGGGEAPGAAAVTNPPPASPSPQTASGQPQRSGRAWSEQAIAQPPPRAVPAPPAAHAVRRRTAREPAGRSPRRRTRRSPSTGRGAAARRSRSTIFRSARIRCASCSRATRRARKCVSLTKAQPSRTVNFELQRPPVAAAAPRPAPAPVHRGAAPTVERYSGSLFVASNPPGARVFIDGRSFGTTPARIPDVPIGSHVVRLELPTTGSGRPARALPRGRRPA